MIIYPKLLPKNDLFTLCTWTYYPHPCIVLGLIIGNPILHLWRYFWFLTSERWVYLENLINLCSYSCMYLVKYRYVKYQNHMLPSSCQGWSVGHLAIWLPTHLPHPVVPPSVCSLPLLQCFSPTSVFSPCLDPTGLFSASGGLGTSCVTWKACFYLVLGRAGYWWFSNATSSKKPLPEPPGYLGALAPCYYRVQTPAYFLSSTSSYLFPH